jgi:hypothetical protein
MVVITGVTPSKAFIILYTLQILLVLAMSGCEQFSSILSTIFPSEFGNKGHILGFD